MSYLNRWAERKTGLELFSFSQVHLKWPDVVGILWRFNDLAKWFDFVKLLQMWLNELLRFLLWKTVIKLLFYYHNYLDYIASFKKKEKKLEWTTCLTPSHQAFLSLWLMKIFHYSRLRKAVRVCGGGVGVCVRVHTCICVLLCVRTNLLLFLGMCGSIQNQFEYIRLSMFILDFTL